MSRARRAVVEIQAAEPADVRDDLNAPDTACSTDVREIDLEIAQRDQGDVLEPRDDLLGRCRDGHIDYRRGHKMRAFLADFSLWGNMSSAAKAAGIPRRTIYRWQEVDEAFSAAFKQAAEAATERLEREAWRRAVEGSPYERTSYWKGEPVGTDRKMEYSDQLMMLLLRARRPDLYREKVDLSVSTVIKTVAGVDPSSVL